MLIFMQNSSIFIFIIVAILTFSITSAQDDFGTGDYESENDGNDEDDYYDEGGFEPDPITTSTTTTTTAIPTLITNSPFPRSTIRPRSRPRFTTVRPRSRPRLTTVRPNTRPRLTTVRPNTRSFPRTTFRPRTNTPSITIASTDLTTAKTYQSRNNNKNYGYGSRNNFNQNVGQRPWSDGTFREEDTTLNRFIGFFSGLFDDFSRIGTQDSIFDFIRFQLNRFIDVFRAPSYDLHNHFYHCTQRIDGCRLMPLSAPITTTIDPFFTTAIDPFSTTTDSSLISLTTELNFEPIIELIRMLSSSSSLSKKSTIEKERKKNDK